MAPTGQNIPEIEDEDARRRHHQSSTRVANLSKLIDVELDLLKKSFEEAKRRVDPVMAQIDQARLKFEELLLQGGGEIIDIERELRELKQTTSKLKSKIPFNLIADPDPEYQPGGPQISTKPLVDELMVDNQPRPDPDIVLGSFFQDPRPHWFRDGVNVLWCFLAFPEGAFIKVSLLFNFMYASFKLYPKEHLLSIAGDLVLKGCIKSVAKRHCRSTVYGFWMDPLLRRSLRKYTFVGLKTQVMSIDRQDIIYEGSVSISSTTINPTKDLNFLHLGKWQRSPTHHIEMPDPNLYFKHTGPHMPYLRYISFRGVSVMKELPNFITNLPYLCVLDLKACHHLEVVPPDIGNLWRSLTHLDMSECYFLDHMPASLSELRNLCVLKGFFVGETRINNDSSCSLQDLSSLKYLIKLNIYTSLKTFPSQDHLTILQGFKDLRNLTICWGGSSTGNEDPELTTNKTPFPSPDVEVKDFSFNLEKLDLRGVPEEGTRNWLRPSNFEKLEKLYIRGGQLSALVNIKEARKGKRLADVNEHGWRVKTMRLRHLNKLQMDWSELRYFFPTLVRVEKIECPNLTSFPCDDGGLWRRTTAQPTAATSF